MRIAYATTAGCNQVESVVLGVTPACEPCRHYGRAALPRRLDMKAAQQRSPTKKGFMVTRRTKSPKVTTDEPCERCAAFMPLQCCICEGIRIVPMLLDVLMLRRNKFRDPRIIGTKRANFFRKETTHEPCHDIGRVVVPRHSDINAAQQHSPAARHVQRIRSKF